MSLMLTALRRRTAFAKFIYAKTVKWIATLYFDVQADVCD